ncbi:hypothetical protein [Aeoliella mucimassa]|uniref:Lipoprotein n=1 Tax=Aeoliella mucimassa TaxID=2527972 RepID=A0A518AVN4_9BACT|nr:hypothetical protein [Aeoliella mucimassa]QDU58784.1 hypothetical protein Pan181_50240 [Aeoliella mucimassa]
MMRFVSATLLLLLVCGCEGKIARVPELRDPQQQSVDQPGLEFFNSLSGQLEIELSEPAERVAENLANEAAPPTATIVSLTFVPEIFVEETEEFRPLTEEELSRVAYKGASITLVGEGGVAVEHKAPNGQHFTVAELVTAVEKTEKESRAKSEWLDGIDVHHIFFEGMYQEEDGSWWITWGS